MLWLLVASAGEEPCFQESGPREALIFHLLGKGLSGVDPPPRTSGLGLAGDQEPPGELCTLNGVVVGREQLPMPSPGFGGPRHCINLRRLALCQLKSPQGRATCRWPSSCGLKKTALDSSHCDFWTGDATATRLHTQNVAEHSDGLVPGGPVRAPALFPSSTSITWHREL